MKTVESIDALRKHLLNIVPSRSRISDVAIMALILLAMGNGAEAQTTNVVNFDDLPRATPLSGTHYAGLFWEVGDAGYQGNIGGWGIPNGTGIYPHSGLNDVINLWGSTLTGIDFPSTVNVLGAYFAAQGDGSSWTVGVRVHGYRSGQEVAVTDWFTDIDAHSDWFQMNLFGVDRIVVESYPRDQGGGWYGLDDLTYVVPEPSTGILALLGCFCISAMRPDSTKARQSG
jgi:hypothetical protein